MSEIHQISRKHNTHTYNNNTPQRIIKCTHNTHRARTLTAHKKCSMLNENALLHSLSQAINHHRSNARDQFIYLYLYSFSADSRTLPQYIQPTIGLDLDWKTARARIVRVGPRSIVWFRYGLLAPRKYPKRSALWRSPAYKNTRLRPPIPSGTMCHARRCWNN